MLRKLGMLALLLVLNAPVQAQVSPAPSTLNYQGRLATPAGNPVPDGNYSVRFSLWDAATAGTEKWNQTVATVVVKNGTFAAALNASTAGLFDGNLWLETKIGSDAALTPRQQLVSVAYALKANTVPDASITNAKIADNTLTISKFAGGVLNFNTWLLGGNSGITASNFLGTTDANPLAFRTNNVNRMRLGASGGLGINNIDPDPTFALTLTAPTSSNRLLILRNSANGNLWFLNTNSANDLEVTETLPTGLPVRFSLAKTTGEAVSQSQTNFPNAIDDNFNPLWQTFQPSRSGFVTKIRVYATAFSGSSGQLVVNLYRGQNFSGTALASSSITNQGGALAWRDFPLSQPLYVVANQTYTFRILGSPLVQAGFAAGDPYSRGRSSISATTDLAFEVIMSNSAGAAIANNLTINADTAAPAGLNIANTNDNNFAIRLTNASTSFETGMLVTDAGFFQITSNVNGGAFARLDGTGAWTSSDRRLKSDIQPLGDLLDKALQLKPVSYYFKTQDKQRDPNRHIGFIAQDVETLFPSLVAGTDTKTLNYTGLSVVAIGALQEMNHKTDADRKRMDALEAENRELKQRLDALEATLLQQRK